MKNLAFLIALLPFILCAQENSLTTLVQLSEADSNCTKISVSEKAFALMSHIKPDTLLTEDIMKMMNSINGMNAYIHLSAATGDAVMAKLNESKTLEEYTKVVHNQKIFALFIYEKDGVVKEAIFFVKEKNDVAIASIYGEINLALIGELMRALPFQQFHKMAK